MEKKTSKEEKFILLAIAILTLAWFCFCSYGTIKAFNYWFDTKTQPFVDSLNNVENIRLEPIEGSK